MKVDVKPEVRKFIDTEIARGRYRTPTELVERAIEVLREQDDADERQLADLRELIAVARTEAQRGEEVEYRNGAALIADVRARRADRR